MVGTGNDFILIDTFKEKKIVIKRSILKKLCSRRTGIGADGILILEKDKKYPFKMRYFNADGYEAEMCGNGARCIALYAFYTGLVSRTFSFASQSGVHSVKILKGNYVTVTLPPFLFIKTPFLITLQPLSDRKNTFPFITSIVS